jgi:hypothetical protein
MLKIIINFLIGCGFIFVGSYVFVVKTDLVLGFFGRMEFFEKWLGTDGGSRLGYKFIGILIIFLGFLVAFGLIDRFMLWSLSPLIRYQ